MNQKLITRLTKFQRFIKRVEASNKEFKRAGRAKKIVMVANDVLAMLELRRLEACPGMYVRIPNVDIGRFGGLEEMSEVLKVPILPPCTVCAIGAGMLAATLRLDSVSILGPRGNVEAIFGYTERDVDGSNDQAMSAQTRKVFPNNLLRSMEWAFEQRSFGYTSLNATSRLRAIYTNLVKNNGKKFTHHRSGEEVWPKYCVTIRPA